MSEGLLSSDEVAKMVGISKPSVFLWAKSRQNGFPQQLKLGRLSRWRASEVEEWLNSRPRGAYGGAKQTGAKRGRKPRQAAA